MLVDAILAYEIDISLSTFIFDFDALQITDKVTIYHHSWRFELVLKLIKNNKKKIKKHLF